MTVAGELQRRSVTRRLLFPAGYPVLTAIIALFVRAGSCRLVVLGSLNALIVWVHRCGPVFRQTGNNLSTCRRVGIGETKETGQYPRTP
jgi:hypothetical protein